MLGKRDGGLVRGNERSGVRNQIAQDSLTLSVSAVGKVDLRQRDFGKRCIVGIGVLRDVLEALFRLRHIALVGLDGRQIVRMQSDLRRCPNTCS